MKTKILICAVLFLAFLFVGPLLVVWLVGLVFSPSFNSFVFGGGGISYWQALGLSFLCAWLSNSTPNLSEEK